MNGKNILISVIIPVYNNSSGLRRTLEAVSNQGLPREAYEVIVVDNGSIDSPGNVAREFRCVFVEEETYLGSPYSARNRGLEIAKGDIIALLDATCAPIRGWLQGALDCFQHTQADLVGGAITFDVTKESTLGEKYDSLANVRMKESIERRSVAKTGNLFVRTSVFEKIGRFPEGLRSGGDVAFTKKATQSGLRLVYCPQAEAVITPRGFKPLVKKQLRVAKGQPSVWRQEGSFSGNFVKKVLFCWVPPSPFFLARSIKNSGNTFLYRDIVGLVAVGLILRMVTAYGVVTTVFKGK